MVDTIYLVVAAFALLETKHLIADFFVQTRYQLAHKRIYGHPGGLLHAAIQACGSSPVFLLIQPSAAVGVSLIAAEFLLHYHIDWVREQLGHRWKLYPDGSSYWRVLGIDQWLHHMTYVAFVIVLAGHAYGAP
jgi:hypothetical protein